MNNVYNYQASLDSQRNAFAVLGTHPKVREANGYPAAPEHDHSIESFFLGHEQSGIIRTHDYGGRGVLVLSNILQYHTDVQGYSTS